VSGAARVDVVIPTIARPALGDLLAALGRDDGPRPGRIVVVDDRARAGGALPVASGWPAERLRVVAGRARGPAAARNDGWRAASAPWVAFLDDDVLPEPGWLSALDADLVRLGPRAGASQGRIRVPLPAGRRPTDWERDVAGLEGARWATADMAYRRAALLGVGGFDERYPRAYREDADLALRVRAAGWTLCRGRRQVSHPPGAGSPFVSVRRQAGNADDALMAAVHGREWRRAAGAPPGRRGRHLLTAGAGLCAAVAALAGRPGLAALGTGAWACGTLEFAWARIAPGPRTPREVATMLATSALIPPAAAAHWARGRMRWRGAGPWTGRPEAVLLDRDGTLVVDVPYNGDPERVAPMPGAREALDRLRAAGIPLGVVSNQSGVARGLVSADDVRRVNRRVEDLLGPLGPWMVCPHAPGDGCGCRKPAPGLVLRGAGRLGVPADRCAVVGDIGADVEAARAAGARAIMVPTPRTRPEEVAAAPEVASDLGAAVDLLIGAGA
jgi:histidinol-phosphate phosphatase family protein